MLPGVPCDIKCEKCENMALYFDEYQEHTGETFENKEPGKGGYYPLYKCLICGYITRGEWVPYTP